MSKLSTLQGKSKEFKIGEINLTIHPLTVKDLELLNFSENMPPEKQMEMTKKLIQKVLKESVPDATDDEVDKIGFEHLEPIMNAIMEVNNLSKDKVAQIKDGIPTRQVLKRT